MNCTVNSNSAAYGGGIENDGSSGSATLTITNITLSGNSAFGGGGGIYNQGYTGSATLMIVNSTLSSNSAGGNGGGGIVNLGSLTIVNSTVSSNSTASDGGGIYDIGGPSMTIANSTVSGNSAVRSGGGILSSSAFGGTKATIANSTLSDNSASSGGIINESSGYSATLTVTNCTLSGNSATNGPGGGIYNISGYPNATLIIVNSTLSGNSGGASGCGIINDGRSGSATLELGNDILKAAASNTNLQNLSGSIVSDGYNLASDDGGGYLSQPTDILNTDPMLGLLQDNGGPTFTHSLLPGSPAVDRGKNFSGSLYDQRGLGFPRTLDNPVVPNAPGGDGTDIGAFESQSIGLQLTAPAWDGNGGFQFGLGTGAGVDYTIQISSDLKHWTPVLAFQGSGGFVTVLDPNATSAGPRFYRVSISLP